MTSEPTPIEKAQVLLDRLLELHEKCKTEEPWRVERELRESQDYPDGTAHFTHVYTTGYAMGEAVLVSIAKYSTPETAELLVLMRNNLPDLLRWARAGLGK